MLETMTFITMSLLFIVTVLQIYLTNLYRSKLLGLMPEEDLVWGLSEEPNTLSITGLYGAFKRSFQISHYFKNRDYLQLENKQMTRIGTLLKILLNLQIVIFGLLIALITILIIQSS